MDYLIGIISFIAALVFSLGGIGGAIILIPVLVSLGIPINVAKPVGLFYNTISLTGANVANIRNKLLDFRGAIPIIVTSFLFAIVGAWVSQYIPRQIILGLFIAFLVFSGFMFLFHKRKEPEVYREDNPMIALSLIGILAGLLSGILGIGGGSIISPLLLMLGLNPKKITTITAFVVPFSSFSGFITYWSIGAVDWRLSLIAAFSGMAGATLGTWFMHKKLNSKTVKNILAFILLLMAAKLSWPLLAAAIHL